MPLLDMEVDVLENRRAFRVVTENDVIEVDVAADAAQRDGVGRVGDGRRGVECLEDALHVRGAGDQLVVEVADVGDRIPEVVGDFIFWHFWHCNLCTSPRTRL